MLHVITTLPGISRQQCVRCGEETLHRNNRCVHCDGEHVSEPVRDGSFNGKAQGEKPTGRRVSRRRNALVTDYQGQQMTLAAVAEAAGLDYLLVYSRYKFGDRGEQLTRPVAKVGQRRGQTREGILKPITVEYQGAALTLAELARRTGLCETVIRQRYSNGDRGPDLWRRLGTHKRRVSEVRGVA